MRRKLITAVASDTTGNTTTTDTTVTIATTAATTTTSATKTCKAIKTNTAIIATSTTAAATTASATTPTNAASATTTAAAIVTTELVNSYALTSCCHILISETLYTFDVSTGDQIYAGTDAKVRIRVTNNRSGSGLVPLSRFDYNIFERGQ